MECVWLSENKACPELKSQGYRKSAWNEATRDRTGEHQLPTPTGIKDTVMWTTSSGYSIFLWLNFFVTLFILFWDENAYSVTRYVRMMLLYVWHVLTVERLNLWTLSSTEFVQTVCNFEFQLNICCFMCQCRPGGECCDFKENCLPSAPMSELSSVVVLLLEFEEP